MSRNWDTKSLEPDAFELHQEKPWEFRWVRLDPKDPDSEMIYKKCPTKKVIGVRSTGVSSRGGSSAEPGKIRAASMAASFVCPCCEQQHSPVQPCKVV